MPTKKNEGTKVAAKGKATKVAAKGKEIEVKAPTLLFGSELPKGIRPNSLRIVAVDVTKARQFREPAFFLAVEVIEKAGLVGETVDAGVLAALNNPDYNASLKAKASNRANGTLGPEQQALFVREYLLTSKYRQAGAITFAS